MAKNYFYFDQGEKHGVSLRSGMKFYSPEYKLAAKAKDKLIQMIVKQAAMDRRRELGQIAMKPLIAVDNAVRAINARMQAAILGIRVLTAAEEEN